MENVKEELIKLENFIDDLDLQQNNLSEKEIDKIKKSIRKTLKKYYNSKNKTFSVGSLDRENKNVNFIISEENKKYKFGARNTEFLKTLIYYGTKNSHEITGELLYNKTFPWRFRETILDLDEICYIHLTITTHEVIGYKLDNYFRVLKYYKRALGDMGWITFNPYGKLLGKHGKCVSFMFPGEEESEFINFICGNEYDTILKNSKRIKLTYK